MPNGCPPPSKIEQGDIYFIKAGDKPPTGTEIWEERPGVVMSVEQINNRIDGVLIAYMTTSQKRWDIPTNIAVKCEGKDGVVICLQTQYVDKSRLERYMGHVTEEELEQLKAAFSMIIGRADTHKIVELFNKWEHDLKEYEKILVEHNIEPITEDKIPTENKHISASNQSEKEIQELKDEIWHLRELVKMYDERFRQIRNMSF